MGMTSSQWFEVGMSLETMTLPVAVRGMSLEQVTGNSENKNN